MIHRPSLSHCRMAIVLIQISACSQSELGTDVQENRMGGTSRLLGVGRAESQSRTKNSAQCTLHHTTCVLTYKAKPMRFVTRSKPVPAEPAQFRSLKWEARPRHGQAALRIQMMAVMASELH
ncbi:hypothetical protein NDU88_004252 [Pleurodeles waltl]|uniref:Secreted protein n=1 Tax=Pleurodeles waltl TaxID=8319 RepID=A0AAV7UFZ5_PLEWA|nr:hypothetical protein NDU88_004252 [Pleurodeles waltl]